MRNYAFQWRVQKKLVHNHVSRLALFINPIQAKMAASVQLKTETGDMTRQYQKNSFKCPNVSGHSSS